jgi:hypothetical protein
MLSSLYLKLIASAVIIGLVAGAYFYVTGLQHKVESLSRDNATLQQSNDQLKGELTTQKQFQSIIEQVINSGDKVKEQNKTVRNNQLKKIDDSVRAGKDKAVGPLLRDFLNDE